MLLSELIHSLANAVKSEVKWSGSQIAIWWIKQCEKVWNFWVQNHGQKISEIVPPSKLFSMLRGWNPANVGTLWQLGWKVHSFFCVIACISQVKKRNRDKIEETDTENVNFWCCGRGERYRGSARLYEI